ncbi:MAG: helix-turn-helix domain-containing protein [Pseudomonadota bacterium]
MTTNPKVKPPAQPGPNGWDKQAIKAALEREGWNLRKLSLESGFHAGICRDALQGTNTKGARLIADTLRVSFAEMFGHWPTYQHVVAQDDRELPARGQHNNVRNNRCVEAKTPNASRQAAGSV